LLNILIRKINQTKYSRLNKLDEDIILESNYYKDLFIHMNEAILFLNEKFEIESVNKSTETLFGITENSTKNKSINSIFPGLESIIRKRDFSLKSKLHNDLIELPAFGEDKKQFLAEISISKLNSPKKPLYALLVRDITDQRREQEALIKAEALIEGHLEVENTRLLEEERKLLLLREELRLASEIQQKLLPKSSPDIPGYDMTAVNIAAKEVGGDYFDFIEASDNNLIFCLGDVSGKGMPASLIMSNLQSNLHTQALLNLPVKESVKNANKIIHANTDSTKFITLFYGILDFKKHIITYCNAGHDRPVFLRDGALKKDLSVGGIPIGCMPDFEYKEEKIPLERGSVLVLYSDGITEAMNQKEEEFGLERLTEILYKNRYNPSEEISKIVLEQIADFCGETEQMDDITLLVLKRES
jgi:PAS domain S-box-containing protein